MRLSTMSDAATGPDSPEQGSFVFPPLSFSSPLEQLARISEEKQNTLTGLGEHEQAERVRRAFELARTRLIELLHEEG
jgi:hypothetical protein